MKKISLTSLKSIKTLVAVAFFFATAHIQLMSQECLNCPEINQNTIKVPATINITDIPGEITGQNECYLILANAHLIINVPMTFSNCIFTLGANSSIRLLSTCQFTGEVSEIYACGPNAIGVHVTSGASLIANALHMNLGSYELAVGIKAEPNSQVSSVGNLTIDHTTLGIQCAGNASINLTSANITATTTGIAGTGNPDIDLVMTTINARDGILCTGNPNLSVLSGSTIIATRDGIKCTYDQTANTLQISQTNISVGTGGYQLLSEAIHLEANTPILIPGAIIERCTIDVNNGNSGIAVTKLNDIAINQNKIYLISNSVLGPVGINGITLNYVEGVEGADINFNEISFTGTNAGQSHGLLLSSSPDWKISNNIFEGLGEGLFVSGNCSSPTNFTENTFIGTVSNGVGISFWGTSEMGIQLCHTNRWEGTFGLGIATPGGIPSPPPPGFFNPFDNQFWVNPNSDPVYIPTTNVSDLVILTDECEILMFAEGGGEQELLKPNKNQSTLSEYPVEVSPNPTKDRVTVKVSALGIDGRMSIHLTDLTGKILQKGKIESGTSQANFDITDLPSGIYLVRIWSDSFFHVEKLIKSN